MVGDNYLATIFVSPLLMTALLTDLNEVIAS